MRKKLVFLSIALASLLVTYHPVFAKEPKNLDIVKSKLIKYHDSGEYQNDLSKVTDKAMLYLKNQLAIEAKHHSHNKFAIVLDIDETALSNYSDMLKENFGGTLEQIVEAEDQGKDPVIKPTLELYRYAKENNMAVFFITGRKEHSRDITTKNLTDAGYKNWDGLFFKPEDYHQESAAPYKTAARENIEKNGYVILLNVGDQESDLSGKHAKKTFKLPNPYYIIP
jgi:predicted secreted acid phosphatase